MSRIPSRLQQIRHLAPTRASSNAKNALRRAACLPSDVVRMRYMRLGDDISGYDAYVEVSKPLERHHRSVVRHDQLGAPLSCLGHRRYRPEIVLMWARHVPPHPLHEPSVGTSVRQGGSGRAVRVLELVIHVEEDVEHMRDGALACGGPAEVSVG